MPHALMPRAALLATQWLQSQTRVTNHVGNRVSYRLGGTYPAIRVTDLGAIERGPEEQLRRLQIECWADDYDKAEAIAAAVESVVPEAAGVWPAGRCAGGAVESGPFSNPDTESEKFRHQLDVALWIYPT